MISDASLSNAHCNARRAASFLSKSAADDDRMQVFDRRVRTKHQLGLGWIDAKFGCTDAIDIDATGTDGQCRARREQCGADHAHVPRR